MQEAAWAREDCGAVERFLRRDAEAGPPRMMRNGGRLCAGAYLRGKSILYITFNMTELFTIRAKSIPSQISRWSDTWKCERAHQRALARTRTHTHTRTNAQMNTRTHTRRALTYATICAAPPWTREQWRSATKASQGRTRPSIPSHTRCGGQQNWFHFRGSLIKT